MGEVTQTDETRIAALAWHHNGFNVLPVRDDGSKAPTVTWTEYQTVRYPAERLARVTNGFGLLCGAISGQLEMLELEGRAVAEGYWPTITQLAASQTDAAIAWAVITASPGAYLEQTPSGGVHILYRLADGHVPGSTKLASRPARPDELTDQEREVLQRKPDKVFPRVLVETRGEGGFVVVAPSHGPTHKTGQPWQIILGQPGAVPTITTAQRDALHELLRTLDRMPTTAATPTPPSSATPSVAGGAGRPGDDYNKRATWAEILEPHGWRQHYRRDDGITYWTRPGKTDGISASTNATGTDTLHVFTSSTEFDADSWHDKLGAFAILNHRGDIGAAVRELAAAGYGEPTDRAKAAREDITAILGRPDWHTPSAPPKPTPNLLAPTETHAPGRPKLEILSAAEMADWLQDNLGRGQLAGMLARRGEVVYTPRQGEEGYIAPSRGGDDGPSQIRTVTTATLRSRIQYRYECLKFDPTVKRWKPATFPADAAALALGAPDEMRHLRPLNGVTHVPLIREDGTLLDIPGYDEATRLLYLPDNDLAIPGPMPLADAVALIRRPLGDFRWSGKHDEANMIGLMLTPLLRLLTPPPYKLAAITAHQPGSGKSLLASLLRILHGGVFRAEVPEDEPEWRKQITSILDVTTGPVVQLDNVSGVLRSSTLSGLLTTSRWDDRRLGGNTMVTAVNDRLWIITGNNVALGGDLLRRTVWVTIDPGIPDPHLRHDFTIPDLTYWTAQHRGPLIRALLTLVQAWIAEGRPTEPGRADSYGRWISVVRAILAVAGIPGVFDHEESAQQTAGEDDQEWSEFLNAIHAVLGESNWTVAKLLDHVNGPGKRSSLLDDLSNSGIPLDALPAALVDRITRTGTVGAVAKSLGRWLSNRMGRWADGKCVRVAGDVRGVKEWRLEVWRA